MPNHDLVQPSNVPDLQRYQRGSVDLCPDYWSPEKTGEKKRMIFIGWTVQTIPSADEPGELVHLHCAMFIERREGILRAIANGSKRLVGVFKDEHKGQAFEITYLGRAKNKTNAHSSAAWSVVQLREAKEKTDG